MRTDTEYFRAKMELDLRESGVTGPKARLAANAIVETAELRNWPEVSSSARARVCAFSADMQSVFVDDEGLAVLHTGIKREHQPILPSAFGRQRGETGQRLGNVIAVDFRRVARKAAA